jgi:GNAT superfamily N-acetyltransferase
MPRIHDRRFLDGRDTHDAMRRIDDVLADVADIYRSAVQTVGPAYYDADQVAAWAGAADKPTVLGDTLARSLTILRRIDHRPAAVGQIDTAGHIGLLYVHGDVVRQGHGGQLLVQLLHHAGRQGAAEATIAASHFSARLAARQGFTVVAEERPEYAGVHFTRWRMRKTLRG